MAVRRYRFETNDATPQVDTIATLTKPGQFVMIPELMVVGAMDTGVVGNVHRGGYSALNVGSGPALRSLFSLTQAWGVGGLTITVGVAGDDVQLTMAGLAATLIRWQVYYRRFLELGT